MADLFISYARADDEPFVKRLYAGLTARGFDVWWDREAMESRGRTFLQEIRDAIAAVDRVLLVVGPEAVQYRLGHCGGGLQRRAAGHLSVA